MSDASFSADALEDSVSRLTALSTEFFEQVGKLPSLGELLEILGWASYGIYPAPLTFKAKLKGNRSYERRSDSLVDELNDSIFVDGAAFLDVLAREPSGQLLSTSGMASALAATLNDPRISLEDVESEEWVRLTVNPQKRITKPKIGDILAIPAKGGSYYMALIVARNRFGTALGFLRGKYLVPKPKSRDSSVARRFPVYTDDRLVSTGVWNVVAHDESLLSLFPAEPEIYHAPDLQWPGVDLGEFGAAETAAGSIRLIGLDEAREVGLLDGTYQQSYLGESVQQLMDDSVDCC
ncbi:hypothetical protein [Streptomyces sp. NPDC002845]